MSPLFVRLALSGSLFCFGMACSSPSDSSDDAPRGPGPREDQDPGVQSPYLGGAVTKETSMAVPTSSLTGEDLETGDTVACIDATSGAGVINRLELFEYYEAQELAPRTISLGDRALDPWARAMTVAKRLASIDPGTAGAVSGYVMLLKQGFRALPSAKLFGLPLTDAIISLPQGCFLIQAATVVSDVSQSRVVMYADAAIWQTMNSDQQTGLILHEALKLAHQVTFDSTQSSGSSRDVPSARQASQPPSGAGSGSTSAWAAPVARMSMTHRLFRDWHVNLVDIKAGFGSMTRRDYIDVVRDLGQKTYMVGKTAFDLDYTLSFHDDDATKVEAGYGAKNYDQTFETELFKPIYLHGFVNFYPSGKVRAIMVGDPVSSTTNGIPTSFHQYESWDLKAGSSGSVAGRVAFSESGQVMAMQFGFFPVEFALAVDGGSVSIPPPIGQIGSYVEREIQSFNFVPGTPFSCSRCAGSLAFSRRAVEFREVSLKTDAGAMTWDGAFDSRLLVTFPGISSLRVTSLTVREDGSLISADPYGSVVVSCPNGGSTTHYGALSFDSSDRLTATTDGPVACSDYTLSATGQ